MNSNSICHPPICNLPSYYFTQSPHPSSVSLVTLTNPTPQLTKLKPTKLYLTKLRFILNSFPLFDRCLIHTHPHTHINWATSLQLHTLSDFFCKLMFSMRSAKKVKKRKKKRCTNRHYQLFAKVKFCLLITNLYNKLFA